MKSAGIEDRPGPSFAFGFAFELVFGFAFGLVLALALAHFVARPHAPAPGPTGAVARAVALDAHPRPDVDEALLQRVSTQGLAAVCGKHPDVAPVVRIAAYRALLAALRAEPRLLEQACRAWRSYRET